jgi:hypothetical protein
MTHAYNPSTWEAEAGRSEIIGQPVLHSESLSQNFFLTLKRE